MSTLAKADIVKAVLADTILSDKTRAEVKGIVNDLVFLMKNAIIEDKSLNIPGFGKFRAHRKSVRRGTNPLTGESIMLPEKTVAVFHLSRKFRHELNS